MGYFEGLTQAAFNKDERGRQLYFPNAKLGRGYVMETDAQYEEFKSFHKKRLMIVIAASFLLVILDLGLTVILAGLAIVLAVDYLVTKARTKNLERAVNKFNVKEAQGRLDRTIGLPFLIFFELVFIVMFLFFAISTLGGLHYMKEGEEGFLYACIGITLFSAFMCWLFAKKIKVAWKARKD